MVLCTFVDMNNLDRLLWPRETPPQHDLSLRVSHLLIHSTKLVHISIIQPHTQLITGEQRHDNDDYFLTKRILPSLPQVPSNSTWLILKAGGISELCCCKGQFNGGSLSSSDSLILLRLRYFFTVLISLVRTLWGSRTLCLHAKLNEPWPRQGTSLCSEHLRAHGLLDHVAHLERHDVVELPLQYIYNI